MNRYVRSSSSKRRSSQAGQALLEFTLLVPFLALLALGGLELSRVFIVQRHLVSAAHTGARTGTATGATVTHVNQAIDAYLDSTSVGDSFSTDIAGVGPTSDSDTMVTVTVGHQLQLISAMAVPSASETLTLPLSASVTMRHQ